MTSDRPARIPQPTVRLTELAIALAAIPLEYTGPLHAVLARMGADHGWDECIRGLCTVLSVLLESLEAGESLRGHLDALDAADVTNGSLQWVVEE